MTAISGVTTTPPAASTSNAPTTSSLNELSGNFDTFIKLLTSQLQYQDPLEPTDTSKFTEQLVQYSQVEQQIGTNDKLDKVIGTLAVAGGQSYLNYIGRTIDADSSQAILRNGTASLGYKLPDNASSVTITVKDDNGKTIRTITADPTIGDHSVAWDGKDDNGNTIKDGVYDFSVSALNATGAPLTGIKQYITAKVVGVDADSTGALLDIGNSYTITPTQVYNVRDDAI